VVVADLNEAAASAVAEGIQGLAVRCNVAEEMDLRRLLAVAETVGPVEIFVANAGIPCDGGYEATKIGGPWGTWGLRAIGYEIVVCIGCYLDLFVL